MRKFAISSLVLCGLLIGLPLSAQAAGSPKTKKVTAPAVHTAIFSLKPEPETSNGYFKLNVSPGSSVTRTVVIENLGNTAGAVKIAVVDGATAGNSGAVYQDIKSPLHRFSPWVTISTKHLFLQPQEKKLITFTVHPPRNAGSGYRLVGLVTQAAKSPATTLPSGSKRFSLHLITVTSVIVGVEINLGAPYHEKFVLPSLQTGETANYQSFFLPFQDVGNTLCKGKGTAIIYSGSGAASLLKKGGAASGIQASIYSGSDPKLKPLLKRAITLNTMVPFTNKIAYPIVVQHNPLGAGKYVVAVHLNYCKVGVMNAFFPISVSEKEAQAVLGHKPPKASKIGPFPTWLAILIAALILALAGFGAHTWRKSKKHAAELQSLREELAKQAGASSDSTPGIAAAGAIAGGEIIAAAKRDDEDEDEAGDVSEEPSADEPKADKGE